MIGRKKGQIVFVGSIVGRFALPYCSSYTASKHALQAFADCLRSEIAKDNIKVLVSSPGFVKTDIMKNALTGGGTPYGSTLETDVFLICTIILIFRFVSSILFSFRIDSRGRSRTTTERLRE